MTATAAPNLSYYQNPCTTDIRCFAASEVVAVSPDLWGSAAVAGLLVARSVAQLATAAQ